MILACGPNETLDLEPPPVELRRLSHFEYNNAVFDLLGDETHPADRFPEDPRVLGFDNNATAQHPSPLLAESYLLAAERLAKTVVDDPSRLAALVPCDPQAIDEACVRTFSQTFGRRAYRRPLSEDELDSLLSSYAKGEAEAGPRGGIQRIVERVLQSPWFLYRVELGVPSGAEDGALALTRYELAARLSLFLWASVPDDTLLDAAAAGELQTPEQLEAQAWRMLDDPRARAMVRHFHRQWLGLDRLREVSKSAVIFPEYKPEWGERMLAETELFAERVTFDEGGGLRALLTASYLWTDPELATLYGVVAQETATGEPTRVELDPMQRAGILTQLSVLAGHATASESSPIRRGKLVREQLLCEPLNPPPPTADISLPAPDPDATTRERFAQHTADPTCAGCHTQIDPIGFGLENYDALGRYRSEENGFAIDASGEVVGSDIEGGFVGAIELAHQLAESEQVRRCVARQWYRYALGRAEDLEVDFDRETLEALDATWVAAELDLQALLVALVTSDAFRVRARNSQEGAP